MRNTLYQKFVTVCNNREWKGYSFITYYLSITCIIFPILFTQDSVASVAWKKKNMDYFVPFTKNWIRKLDFLKKNDMPYDFIFGCGYISLIVNFSEGYNRTTNSSYCFWLPAYIDIVQLSYFWSSFFVGNADPLTNEVEGEGRGPYPSPAFFESTLPGWYPRNSLLFHSPKYFRMSTLSYISTVKISSGGLH